MNSFITELTMNSFITELTMISCFIGEVQSCCFKEVTERIFSVFVIVTSLCFEPILEAPWTPVWENAEAFEPNPSSLTLRGF